jgi:methylmalonyl-CoA mutase
METMYQRGKIQEESLYYETLKHSGRLPIIGVNTFLSSEGSPTVLPREVIRATEDEKKRQIETVHALHERSGSASTEALRAIQQAAVKNQNVFDRLMKGAKTCSLGQMTQTLFKVGGE